MSSLSSEAMQPKTWGPFNGRQLTILLVALMATVVLVPSAVWAVDSFTNVAIEDPISGLKAKVDTARRLNVGDGSGNMTVDGSVIARPAAPADFFNHYVISSGDVTCVSFPPPPAGKAMVLMTASFDVYSNPSPSIGDYFRIDKGTTCDGPKVEFVTPPGLGHTTLPLDPGVVSTTGFSIQVFGQPAADVTVTGYLVPSAGLPTAAQQQAAAAAEPPPKR